MNLDQSQSFINDAVKIDAKVDEATNQSTHSTQGRSTLTVSYDATAQSYTISVDGRSETFAPANAVQVDNGLANYEKTGAASRDFFSVTIPGTVAPATQYVGAGYWQRNSNADGLLTILFDPFTFGFETAAGAVPRTGGAAYDVDLFGFYTPVGFIPRAVAGAGNFSVDFLSGLFGLEGSVDEIELVGDGGVTPLRVLSGGHLSSSGGTFSGNLSYTGSQSTAGGFLNGRFYGPDAQEVGASFGADAADGSALVGTMIGRRDAGRTPENLALTNLITSQFFYARSGQLQYNVRPDGSYTNAFPYQGVSGVRINTDGSLVVVPPISNLSQQTFSAADRIASTGNFVTYQKMLDGHPLTVRLYKTGMTNTELALTYASFGSWTSLTNDGFFELATRLFFLYGFETPQSTLVRRGGSGHYAGIVYGAGVNRSLGTAYDITGSSTFDVNFGNQSYVGSLALSGTETRTGTNTNFGAWAFGGNMVNNNGFSAQLLDVNAIAGSIEGKFYGPDAEEIAATFSLTTGPDHGPAGTAIAGVTVAKRE